MKRHDAELAAGIVTAVVVTTTWVMLIFSLVT